MQINVPSKGHTIALPQVTVVRMAQDTSVWQELGLEEMSSCDEDPKAIWDSGGSDSRSSTSEQRYRGAVGIVIVRATVNLRGGRLLHDFWVFATCPALRGSTVSYVGVAHVAKNCLEYSMNFWSQSKKKIVRATVN